uniref:Uncharacterized protein n=1 Tax=Rhizophagus irregularis (strain DAOM 181602 / DAOM 197198 / MUCL 43194) TaxID=747089 RepID=U9U7Q2_RHIID
MTKDTSRIQYKEAVDFVSKFNDIFYQSLSFHLSSFIEDCFFKDLFNKNLSKAVNKAQLLIENNICLIQNLGKFRCPVFYMTDDESLADEPDVTEFNHKVNKLRSRASKTVANTPPKLPDIVMTPVDQTVIPENSRKKDKQKRVLQPYEKSLCDFC